LLRARGGAHTTEDFVHDGPCRQPFDDGSHRTVAPSLVN